MGEYTYMVQFDSEDDSSFEFSYDDSGVETGMGPPELPPEIPRLYIESFNVKPFGESGSSLEILYILNYSDGPQEFPEQDLTLVFTTAIDFTQPLPLDHFSTGDSYCQTLWMGNPLGKVGVRSVTPVRHPG